MNITKKTIVAVLLALATIVGVSSCSLSNTTPAVAAGQAWEKTCPAGHKLAMAVNFDGSDSSVTESLQGRRLEILRDSIARTAVCSGHLRVNMFAGSRAGDVELFNGELSLKGSTDTARFRRVPDLVAEVTETVSAAYADLPEMTDGSDIVGQLTADREYVEQLGKGYALSAVLDTDGYHNAGLRAGQIRSIADAQSAARGLPVPDYSDLFSEVLFVGLGNTTDKVAAPTTVVDRVKAFYVVICGRLGPVNCRVATDYTSPVGWPR